MCCVVHRRQPRRTVVLNLWVATPLGAQTLSQELPKTDHQKTPTFISQFLKTAKLQLGRSRGNDVMVGGHQSVRK